MKSCRKNLWVRKFLLQRLSFLYFGKLLTKFWVKFRQKLVKLCVLVNKQRKYYINEWSSLRNFYKKWWLDGLVKEKAGLIIDTYLYLVCITIEITKCWEFWYYIIPLYLWLLYTKLAVLCSFSISPYMSIVSPVFHTVVTLSIGLKIASRMMTSILQY